MSYSCRFSQLHILTDARLFLMTYTELVSLWYELFDSVSSGSVRLLPQSFQRACLTRFQNVCPIQRNRSNAPLTQLLDFPTKNIGRLILKDQSSYRSSTRCGFSRSRSTTSKTFLRIHPPYTPLRDRFFPADPISGSKSAILGSKTSLLGLISTPFEPVSEKPILASPYTPPPYCRLIK